MLFLSLFKSLVDQKTVLTVEFKSGLQVQGTLSFVDSNMNFYLTNIIVDEKYPHFVRHPSLFLSHRYTTCSSGVPL